MADPMAAEADADGTRVTTLAPSRPSYSPAPSSSTVRSTVPSVIPSLRGAFGFAYHALGVPSGVGFAADVSLGVRVVAESTTETTLWWAPELGYAFEDTPLGSAHFGTASFGVGFLENDQGVALFPRLLVGAVNDQLALGGRVTVQWLLLFGLVGLEAGYQFVHAGSTDLHDVVALAFIDPGMLVGLAMRHNNR